MSIGKGIAIAGIWIGAAIGTFAFVQMPEMKDQIIYGLPFLCALSATFFAILNIDLMHPAMRGFLFGIEPAAGERCC